MADPRSPAPPSRRDLPRRGVHAAEADEGTGQARLHPVLHLLHLARPRSGSCEQYLTELTAYPERDYLSSELLRQHARHPAAIICKAARRWMFKSRAALAATLSSNYGIYNGFELLEHDPIPGREEYLDSEKYEIKVRDWDKPGNIKAYIRDLNRARARQHRAAADQPICASLRSTTATSSASSRNRSTQSNIVVAAIALTRDRARVLASARRRSGSACAGNRRNVVAVENLMTGERYPVEWGGVRPADRSGRDPAAVVPLSGVSGAMNVMHAIDAKELPSGDTGDELWYKDAIIYQLHVKAFADSNNDGIGDFAGLTEKLDYLQDLGVTALWLLPFYPSPGRDDGYDIADYGDINPRFRHDEGFPALHRRGEAPRAAGDHRAGGQPHLRPAPLVQARAPQRSEIERAQLVCVERYRPEIPGHADHLHRHREIELDLGSGSRPVLLASLLLAPARSQFRQPPGASAR